MCYLDNDGKADSSETRVPSIAIDDTPPKWKLWSKGLVASSALESLSELAVCGEGSLTLVERGECYGAVDTITCCWEGQVPRFVPEQSMGAYLRALVFLLLRLRRRTRFFLHLALIFA
jgi:hypothetical protein